MKRILSISLGSSRRDHRIETTIAGQDFLIERRGTDGDKKKAARLFSELDGSYDAFGLGGIDLYIWSGGRRYTFRDARKLIKNVTKTPVVDGSGLKNTLERKVITYLDREEKVRFSRKKVLMVSGVDRFGMAEALTETGAQMIFGDLIFGLNIMIPLHSLRALNIAALILAPIITKLPFELIYPTGNRQDKTVHNKYIKYYAEADIIAGDYHFIRSYMPEKLPDKVIITNTVTEENITDLKKRGVKMLITTTPELKGRSFGTNVMEGILVSLSDKDYRELTPGDYEKLLARINFKPRIMEFNRGE